MDGNSGNTTSSVPGVEPEYATEIHTTEVPTARLARMIRNVSKAALLFDEMAHDGNPWMRQLSPIYLAITEADSDGLELMEYLP